MVYSISWHKTTNDAVERSGLTAIALLAPPHPQKKVSPPLAHRHGRTGDVSMFIPRIFFELHLARQS